MRRIADCLDCNPSLYSVLEAVEYGSDTDTFQILCDVNYPNEGSSEHTRLHVQKVSDGYKLTLTIGEKVTERTFSDANVVAQWIRRVKARPQRSITPASLCRELLRFATTGPHLENDLTTAHATSE